MALKSIQTRYREIAAKLGSSSEIAVKAQHDGSAHAEHINGRYYYIITERGSEYERRETLDPDELLSWFVRDLTFAIAGEWELKHRRPSEDHRRLLFAKHVDLLRSINQSWADQQQADYEAILTTHPYDDASGDRVEYLVRISHCSPISYARPRR